MKFKRKFFLIALVVFSVYLLVGCVGSSKPHNPVTWHKRCGNLKVKRLWWQKTTVGVPDHENPWLAFVRTKRSNEFDPWSADDLQRYSVAPLASASAVYVAPTVIPPPTKDEQIRNALKKGMQEFLREHRRKTSPVY